MFWHNEKKALLVIYVDDFKLAAKACDHDKLWTDIRNVIDMDKESEDGPFLGCDHQTFEGKAKDMMDILQLRPQFYSRPIPG